MKNLIILLLFLGTVEAYSQQQGQGNPNMLKAMQNIKGRVYGKLVDARTGKPVEFAAVAVLWITRDSVLGGSLTGENGEFSIDNLPGMGTFRLRALQIGFKTHESKFFIKPPDKLEQDLGDIKMEVDEKIIQEVEVVTEKAALVMSIDKRTYNVDKDLSVKGGTAADAMKNVPGLTVDGEGNVQLRSQSPMIFVDGRPTTLSLQQIPADQIDRIEVITNPSVNYDAGATAGILNIVMKKNLKPGYNGMAMAYAGTGDRYGGMLNINAKEGKWNVSAMLSYNQAINITQGYTHRTQLSEGEATGFFNQDNNVWQRRNFTFGKIGVDYKINNRNTLSLTQMGMGGWFNTSDNQFFGLFDREGSELQSGKRVNDQHVHFQNYNTMLQYRRNYAKPGKELTADMSVNFSRSESDYLFSTYTPTNVFQKNDGRSKARQGVFQLDYVDPINESSKFEAGVRAFYKGSNSANDTYNAVFTQDLYTRDTVMSNNYVIDDMVNAAYVNYSAKTLWDISYQAGLRFEQSYYSGVITDRDLRFSYQYPSGGNDLLKSLFPAIYFSKKLSKNREWQLNFSRKIQRPNFFQLMPFVMFADRQNYRIGNPQLRPEFRNISELNYSKNFTKGSYLGSGYFRYEEQPITDIAYPAPDDPDVLVNTTINGDNSFRYGMEHTIKYTFASKLDVTFNLNAYSIFIRGQVLSSEPVVTAQGFAFDAKTILSYRLPKQLTIQLNSGYESPRILLLGRTLPVYSTDISLAKRFGSKWSANVTVSDVFNTRRMGTIYSTPYYTQELSRRREARYVRFSVSYMFGKMDASIFKRAKQRTGDQGSQDGLDFGG